MNDFEKLNSDVQKYLRLRKIFREFEFVCLAAIFIVFLYSGGDKIGEIFCCVAAVLIIPESFLSVRRNEIKTSIKNENLKANCGLSFYGLVKPKFEKVKDETSKEEVKKFWEDVIKQLDENCDKNKQIMKDLESIKKRLAIF